MPASNNCGFVEKLYDYLLSLQKADSAESVEWDKYDQMRMKPGDVPSEQPIVGEGLSVKPIAFSVGFEDSPDLESARTVAEYLNIPHDVLVITPEECLKVVPEVIYALETFDPLIIRCGIAHYLLCKHIAKTSDVKVLLSGEGADELFGSYAYMQRAPNAFHLHKEILRRLTHLHQYDVLRFIDLVARLPPAYKLIPMKLEKFILRSAFDGWLPDEVLWRSKEGFAEALGKTDLGDIVHQHASTLISEKLFSERADRFPDRTPETPEEYWYRQIFEDTFHYGKVGPLVHTKVYRTAAWHLVEEKENLKESLEVKQEEQSMMRLRRRSTVSAAQQPRMNLELTEETKARSIPACDTQHAAVDYGKQISVKH
ncbi:asparagine synthase [Teladorsagia circumcincta]|uniref:Asparagine synthase n=1 Tax=Teladorsagia circumcincta TaxID=45464 RepID=A0A2G9UND2_TELCI|nr:asparagine synthase [Teladorsagia circumcincta]